MNAKLNKIILFLYILFIILKYIIFKIYYDIQIIFAIVLLSIFLYNQYFSLKINKNLFVFIINIFCLIVFFLLNLDSIKIYYILMSIFYILMLYFLIKLNNEKLTKIYLFLIFILDLFTILIFKIYFLESTGVMFNFSYTISILIGFTYTKDIQTFVMEKRNLKKKINIINKIINRKNFIILILFLFVYYVSYILNNFYNLNNSIKFLNFIKFIKSNLIFYFNNKKSFLYYIFNYFNATLIEEYVFRFYLINYFLFLLKKRIYAIYILIPVIFLIPHLQYLYDNNCLSIIFFAIITTFLYLKMKDLKYPFFYHFFINLLI